jgi:tol-pal system protein YbgF
MQRVALLSCLLWLMTGCAGSQSSQPTVATQASTASHGTPGTSDPGASRKIDEQQKRIAELESRLALLEAEARAKRGSQAPVRSMDTIRIGSPATVQAREPKRERTADLSLEEELRGEEAYSEPGDEATSRRREPTRTLRLYGKPAAREGDAMALPMADVGALPVVPLPEDRAKVVADGSLSSSEGASLDDYRSGLRAMRERRFDDAIIGFDAFLMKHPRHALEEKAMYWRAEARYAKREYEPARAEFDALLSRFPGSDKVADVLLKLGLCMQHLGDAKAAEGYFRRVRESYPSSQAAVIATREGST